MNKRRIFTLLVVLTLLVVVLMACNIPTVLGPISTSAYPTPLLSPLADYSQESAYAAAQATLTAGQSEAAELSYQATLVSLNMNQAASAAAQATKDYNQRQLMELAIRSTEISQNMIQAAATQQFITQQTQMVWDATGTAQSRVVTAQSQSITATYVAYVLSVTQTSQAQGVLDAQATNVAQANATQVAYALTATPWAVIQADIAQTRDESERRAWWEEFVVTPLQLALLTMIVLLLIGGVALAYWRLMPLWELRMRTITRYNDSPLLLVDAVVVDAAVSVVDPQIASDAIPAVEVVAPSDPSVTNWITEAEQILRSDGRIAP